MIVLHPSHAERLFAERREALRVRVVDRQEVTATCRAMPLVTESEDKADIRTYALKRRNKTTLCGISVTVGNTALWRRTMGSSR